MYYFIFIYQHISQQTSTETLALETSTLWSWTVSSLKFDFRSQRGIFERCANSNKYSLMEGRGGQLSMLCAVCTPLVMQCRDPLAGFSSPAQPGDVTVSEVHPESLSLATEVQAEILQLPRCWKRFTAVELQNLAFGCARCFTKGEHIARLLTVLNFKHLI